MKSIIIFLLLLLIYAPQVAISAQKICLEDAISKIPASAEKTIRKTGELSRKCKLVGTFVNLKGENTSNDIIVTTDASCDWAASAGPVWILRNEGSKYSVVFKFVTYNLELFKDKSNGLRNIKTSRGTAGSAEVEFWAYTGNMYKKTASYYFSANDEETCKAHPSICPFEF